MQLCPKRQFLAGQKAHEFRCTYGERAQSII